MADTKLNGKTSKFSTAIELVAEEIKAQKHMALRQVPTLAGAPGVGKTAALIALAHDLNLEPIVYQLSAIAPEELSGIPNFIEGDPDMIKEWAVNKNRTGFLTTWSVPELAATANQLALSFEAKNAEKEGVLIIFDDIHMADPALERYMFNLFLDKVVGQYKLRHNVYVAAAMNNTDASGFDGFNAAILDRLAIYNVEFDFDYWYSIIGSTLNHGIATYLRHVNNGGELHYILGEESVDAVTPSPRSWTELSKFVSYLERTKGPAYVSNHILHIARPRVGDSAAASLATFWNTFLGYNFESVLKNKELITVPKDDAVKQMIYGMILRYGTNKKDGEFLFKLITHNQDAGVFLDSFFTELVILKKNKKNPTMINQLTKLIKESKNVNFNKIFASIARKYYSNTLL